MLQIDRILYPTDFSKSAEQALTHALFLAEQFEAELHLLHAVVLHADDPHNPAHHFPSTEEILRRLYDIAASAMAELTEPHKDRPVEIREAQRRGFSAAQVILDYAAEHDVDLIVMGTHGRRGPRRMLLGSVCEEVVRLAGCPVLSLRQLEESRPIEEIGRILVPVDFSRHARQIVGYAKEIADRFDATLQFLHVIEEHSYPYFYAPISGYSLSEHVTELQERSLAAFDQLLGDSPGPDVTTERYVVNGEPAAKILEFAGEQASDMIVIATRGLTGVERLLLGSTAERVVRGADCPVLTIRPPGEAQEGEAAG